MSEISIRHFCEALYCALVPLAEFTLNGAGDIALSFASTDERGTTNHDARFVRVRDMVWTPDRPAESEPGDLFEFSAIRVEHSTDGWRVWVHPWYRREVEFHCATITLDGDVMIGSGSWFQDDLPNCS